MLRAFWALAKAGGGVKGLSGGSKVCKWRRLLRNILSFFDFGQYLVDVLLLVGLSQAGVLFYSIVFNVPSLDQIERVASKQPIYFCLV